MKKKKCPRVLLASFFFDPSFIPLPLNAGAREPTGVNDDTMLLELRIERQESSL